MNRKFSLALLVVAALLLGLAASELLYRSAAFRDLAGRLAGRGHVVAIANGKGIYETDLGEDEPSAAELVVLEHLRQAAANETVDPAHVDREIGLRKAQFGEDKLFNRALYSDGLTISDLREKIATQIRGVSWLEKQVRSTNTATEPECRQFYDAHHDLFTQPVRFRASHFFLAAHAETPPEVVQEKEMAIAAFATRLTNRETLAALAAEASEDEATKLRGGDLGYFAETRALPEFVAEITKLRLGETSPPFRSHLGFHIAQVTETKAGRLLTFDEARPEILLALANDHRAARMRQIVHDLGGSD